jgi:hypothetical protein
MKRYIRFKVSTVEGMTLQELKNALEDHSAWIEHTNGGTWLHLSVEDDPKVRESSRGGAPRKELPKGSPLKGMDEMDARAWAAEHSKEELAKALGISVSAAYRRIKSGRIL